MHWLFRYTHPSVDISTVKISHYPFRLNIIIYFGSILQFSRPLPGTNQYWYLIRNRGPMKGLNPWPLCWDADTLTTSGTAVLNAWVGAIRYRQKHVINFSLWLGSFSMVSLWRYLYMYVWVPFLFYLQTEIDIFWYKIKTVIKLTKVCHR